MKSTEKKKKKRLLNESKMIINESFTKRRLQLLERTSTSFNNCPVWGWKGDVHVLHNNKKS